MNNRLLKSNIADKNNDDFLTKRRAARKGGIALTSTAALEKLFILLCPPRSVYGEENASASAIQALLDEGADPNERSTRFSDTVLLKAVDSGNLIAVKMFLAIEGIDIYMTDLSGDTPFVDACCFGHVEIAKILLEKHKKAAITKYRHPHRDLFRIYTSYEGLCESSC
jgi:ankyrin repeat protein